MSERERKRERMYSKYDRYIIENRDDYDISVCLFVFHYDVIIAITTVNAIGLIILACYN